MKATHAWASGLLIAGACLMLLSCQAATRASVSGMAARADRPEKAVRIAFITNMQAGEHWGNMKSGARFSRNMHGGMTLEFYAPVNEADYRGQAALLQQVVNSKFDAVVISPSDAGLAAPVVAGALHAGMKVVTVDNDILSASGVSLAQAHVGCDDREIGRETAAAALRIVPGARSVLIVGSVPTSTSMTAKIAAITEILSQSGLAHRVVFCNADDNLAYQLTRKALADDRTIDVVIALEEYAAHGAADALKELPKARKVAFIGSGNSRYQLILLEQGEMDALVVENSFTMGYLAVEAANDLLNGRTVKPAAVEYAIVTPGTMWNDRNQRLLFPLMN